MIRHVAALAMMAMVVGPAAAGPTQSFLEAPGPSGPLKGTMLSAEGQNGPIALIIPGSGPVDRDGDSPIGIKASTYRLLAEGLAAQGISSVRIDKRGMFASVTAVPDGNTVKIADYAKDAHAWVDVIRQKTGAKCVWLIGHSEGGLVALVAASEASDICGLVLIATAGRRLSDVLREQISSNPANGGLIDDATKAIDALAAGKHVDVSGMHPALQTLFRPQIQDFLIDVFSHDPGKLLKGYSKPVLILQGKRDLQVSETDALLLKEADPQAELAILTDVNHVLKTVASSERTANLATYVDPSLPLAPGVVDTIAKFINGAARHE
jgi:uncharacterized protein